MTRPQRRIHRLVWCLATPAALALVALALFERPAEPGPQDLPALVQVPASEGR